MWAVWHDPLFSVFFMPAPFAETVESVEPFVSPNTFVVSVGLVQQVRLLD